METSDWSFFENSTDLQIETAATQMDRRGRPEDAAAIRKYLSSNKVEWDDPDLIPKLEAGPRSEGDLAIDNAISGIGIVEAYERWCGKMTPKVGSKHESIMVSCPKPTHADKHPSAWLNSDKDTWFCGGCQEGGDIYDIAAWHFGFAVPGYKDADFPELRRRMAEDLGVVIAQSVTGQTVVAMYDYEPEEPPEPQPPLELDAQELPTFDWREVLPQGTFLHDYMTAMDPDPVGDWRFHFWSAVLGVSLAVGPAVEVGGAVANLYVCLLGGTGTGKSEAYKAMAKLVGNVVPFDDKNPYSKGVRYLGQIGSPEALIDGFVSTDTIIETDDEGNTKEVDGPPIPGVRGLLVYDEYASLIIQKGRAGNDITPTLTQMYSPGRISHRSRGKGVAETEDPYCCIVSTTQPESVSGLMTREDTTSGFLNRWIFPVGNTDLVVSSAQEGKRPYGYKEIQDLGPKLWDIHQWANLYSGTTVLNYTDEAEAWIAQSEENEKDFGVDWPVTAKALLARIGVTTKKLMLVLAANKQADEIDLDTAKAAWVLRRYLIQCLLVLDHSLSITRRMADEQAVEDRIRKITERSGQPVSIGKLCSELRQFEKHSVIDLVKTLVQTETIHEWTTVNKQNGRTTKKYSIRGAFTMDEVDGAQLD